jgi:hypothetical protein
MAESDNARIERLEERVRQAKSNHEDILATLPTDTPARVAALATVLGLDAAKAMRGDYPMDTLIAERDERENAILAATTLFREQGVPFAPNAEEG